MANDLTKTYVRDAGNGKYYEESATDDDGGFEYIPADPALKFEELQDGGKPSGKYIEVRDLAERAKQRQGTSHEEYFKKLSEDPDPRKARQAMKRLDKFQEQMTRLAIDKASPVGVPSIEYVKDEQFMSMMEQWKRDTAKGLTNDPDYRDSEFVPFAAYAHKLATRSGTIIRPMYQGEVGMRGLQILCLEQGYGSGTLVNVPAQIEDPKKIIIVGDDK